MIGKIQAGEFLVLDEQIEVEYDGASHIVDLKFSRKTMMTAWRALEAYEQEIVENGDADSIKKADQKFIQVMDKIINLKFIKDVDVKIDTIQQIFIQLSNAFPTK